MRSPLTSGCSWAASLWQSRLWSREVPPPPNHHRYPKGKSNDEFLGLQSCSPTCTTAPCSRLGTSLIAAGCRHIQSNNNTKPDLVLSPCEVRANKHSMLRSTAAVPWTLSKQTRLLLSCPGVKPGNKELCTQQTARPLQASPWGGQAEGM